MAPLVADVDATAGAWHEWTDSLAGGYAPDANGNGSGYVENAAGGANGFLYAATSSLEPMIAAAQSDQPRAGDEPRPDAGDEPRPRPEARADAYDLPPATSHGPVTPEYPWASISQHDTPPAPAAPWEEAEAYREAQAEVVAELTDTRVPAAAPEAEPAPAEWAASPEPEPAPAEWAASPEPEPAPAEWAASPEPEPEPAPAGWAASPEPEPEPAPTPVAHVADLQLPVQLSANQQNIVLRIELAIVDESRRPDAVHVVRRVGQDGDVLDLEYEPRDGGRGLAPWPEYIWDTPPEMTRLRRREPGEQPHPDVAPAVDRQSARPTSQPMTLDWELPAVGPAQSMPDPRAPSAPTVQPVAPYVPAPPQHELPTQPKHPPAAQLPYPPADPLYGLPAAPNPQPARYSPPGYQPAPYSPSMPTQGQYPVPAVQSAPAAGARAGQVNAAADRADLWFLSTQPAAATAADEEPGHANRPRTLMTVGLTIGVALLVLVLMLVFIQLMTSLLR
ncbi:MAG TPA: hypothetical protein VIF08_09070 [Candidatus Limnocylindrales bacterium]